MSSESYADFWEERGSHVARKLGLVIWLVVIRRGVDNHTSTQRKTLSPWRTDMISCWWARISPWLM